MYENENFAENIFMDESSMHENFIFMHNNFKPRFFMHETFCSNTSHSPSYSFFI